MINLRGVPPVFTWISIKNIALLSLCCCITFDSHNLVCTNTILHFAGEGLIAGWATQICQSVRSGIENNLEYEWEKHLAVSYSEEFYAKKVLGNFQLSQEHPANSWWIISTFGCFLVASSSFSFTVLCEEKGRRNCHQKMRKTLTSKSLRFWQRVRSLEILASAYELEENNGTEQKVMDYVHQYVPFM